MRRLLILLLICLLPATALAEQTVTLTFLGDCTIGGEDRLREFDYSFDGYVRAHGYDYFFREVQSVIAHDDLTIANLEGCFINYESGAMKKTYNFRGPKDYVNVLTDSSVEAVSIANNHIMDYGYDGVTHTVNTLNSASLPFFGTNDAIQQTWIYEDGNIRIGFVSMEISYWYYRHRNLLKGQVQELRDAGCDVVICVMHGGEEYRARHLRIQEQFAHAVLDYGVDIIVGHHPHVLQGVEVRDGKTICYSIGNFVFGGNAAIRAPYTAMFQFTLSFAEDSTYLGHQLNIIPALPSGERDFNNYQPVLAIGDDAQAVMDQIQYDTKFTLNPYVEGVGALQDFIPAPAAIPDTPELKEE